MAWNARSGARSEMPGGIHEAARALVVAVMAATLGGRRILVVEDEFLLAMQVADAIRSLGADVLGPLARLASAQDVATREVPDGAILDVRLGGERSDALAQHLLDRGVPVILATGCEPEELSPDLRHLPCLRKPYEVDLLLQMAEKVFGRTEGPVTS